jgi:hypothetical protein
MIANSCCSLIIILAYCALGVPVAREEMVPFFHIDQFGHFLWAHKEGVEISVGLSKFSEWRGCVFSWMLSF